MKYDLPKKKLVDAGFAIARSGLGAIPFAGTAATELLNLIITPPLETRRNEWMESIGEALIELERKMDVTLERLKEKESFIDVFIEASQLALKTSDKEKKKALINIVLNSALDDSPDQSFQKMFLSFISDITGYHLRLLYFFHNPENYFSENDIRKYTKNPIKVSDLVYKKFPEFEQSSEFYEIVCKDLSARHLIHERTLQVLVRDGISKLTTKFGDSFHKYIDSPF